MQGCGDLRVAELAIPGLAATTSVLRRRIGEVHQRRRRRLDFPRRHLMPRLRHRAPSWPAARRETLAATATGTPRDRGG